MLAAAAAVPSGFYRCWGRTSGSDRWREDELWEHRLVSHILFSFSVLSLQHFIVQSFEKLSLPASPIFLGFFFGGGVLFGFFFCGESGEVHLFLFHWFCDCWGLHCKLVGNLLNKSKLPEDKGCRKRHLGDHDKIMIKFSGKNATEQLCCFNEKWEFTVSLGFCSSKMWPQGRNFDFQGHFRKRVVLQKADILFS